MKKEDKSQRDDSGEPEVEEKKEEVGEQISEEDKKPHEESKPDESELEEEIKDTENSLDKNQFHEFLKPSAESFSPVLEKVQDAPRQESLERDVGFVSTSAKQQEDNNIQYNPVSYTESYTPISERDIESSVEESRQIRETFSVSQPAPINMETAGRDLHPQLREVSPVNLESRELRKPQATLEEKYIKPEKIDMEKVGREKAPGRKVQKYEIR